MKSIKYLLLGLAAAGLSACSSDAPEPVPGEDSEGDIYARLTLSLPTRSETIDTPTGDPTNSDAGFEVGSDSENHVTEVLVVLATENGTDYTYQTCALSDARVNPTEKSPTYVIQFQSNALNELVKDNPAEVNVFAYCNPTREVKNIFLDDKNNAKAKDQVGSFINEVLSIAAADKNVEENVIWNPNHFLMTNASLHKIEIPVLATLVKDHNTQAKAFKLGTVDVKRASARFDLAEKTTEAGKNRYVIKDQVTELPAAVIELDAIALMNEAKDFYALPRVSDDGQNTKIGLCGVENSSNWVVSPYALQKAAKPIDWSFFDNKFLFPLGLDASASNSYSFTKFEDICGNKGTEDNKQEDWTNPDPDLNYYIWRYATENTIPAIDRQVKGITTGVIFRGEIKPYVAPEGVELNDQARLLRDLMQQGKVLYAYKGVLYGDAVALKAAAKKVEGTTFERDYDAAFAPANVDAAGNLTASHNGFAIYRPTGTAGNYHYYCYYYYYNRHNDNGDNNNMGAMEFGVVRNNIYKLSVTNIFEYGHPGKPGDDPDPTPKDDPDEEEKAYFKVSVRVLPWVVRVNNIEF